MSNKKFVVAYAGLELINNHQRLFPSFSFTRNNEEYTVLLHTDPQVVRNSRGTLTNYDLCVNTNRMIDYPDSVFLDRHSKVMQASRLGALRKVTANLFVPAIWDTPTAADANPQSYEIPSVVIKHNNGARGICQLLIRNAVCCNKSTIFTHFLKAIKEADVATMCDNDKMLALLQKHICIGGHSELKLFWSGIEERDHGAAATFINSTDYHMQEFVENVIAEYRVIKGVSSNVYYKRTYRVDRSFAQATGGTESIPIHCRDICSDSVLGQRIDSFISQNFDDLNSIDLFILKEPITGTLRFGFFEYCNQYATAFDDPNVHFEMHRDFIIHNLIKNNLLA